MTNIVASITLEALNIGDALPYFQRALNHALTKHPPPYSYNNFASNYRQLAKKPAWFAGLLMSDADLEGYSAKQLWAYSDSLADPDFAHEMRRHARDEGRHARMFGGLLFTLFPHLAAEENREKLQAMAPKLVDSKAPERKTTRAVPIEESLNSAILINLHEIKALILEQLLTPTLAAYAEASDRRSVTQIAQRLIQDEVEHIRYTAEYIEKAANSGYQEYIMEAVSDFQRTLNQVTLGDLEQSQSLVLEGL
ncbi:MAG: ferritin-like domain-containing protein [Planctomycetota bacterium]|nr:ferritin-like domain-containing protein [Planctomycetota bacterium]